MPRHTYCAFFSPNIRRSISLPAVISAFVKLNIGATFDQIVSRFERLEGPYWRRICSIGNTYRRIPRRKGFLSSKNGTTRSYICVKAIFGDSQSKIAIIRCFFDPLFLESKDPIRRLNSRSSMMKEILDLSHLNNSILTGRYSENTPRTRLATIEIGKKNRNLANR